LASANGKHHNILDFKNTTKIHLGQLPKWVRKAGLNFQQKNETVQAKTKKNQRAEPNLVDKTDCKE